MKKLQILSLILFLALSSCLNNIDDVSTTQQTPNPDILENYQPAVRNITGSLTGSVVDDNNEPVAGAVVRLGSLNTTTDSYGHFFFEEITMNALGQLVRVEEEGFFDGSRRFFPLQGAMSRVRIQMIPKVFNASFNSVSGGIVQATDGGSLEFNANSIKDASGAVYAGEVKLAAQWLDPTALSTFDRMPGNLQGVNTQNREMALATYGMMAVELQSPLGESLNLLDGAAAKITMPVPSSLIGSAPAEIPLWSYSEAYGVWVEEGTAMLIGNEYVGEVQHFSFWNCDIPLENVFFETQVTDIDGNALANYMVTIESSSSGTGYGWTDMEGNVSGIIPANQVLTINVYGPCEDLLYSADIGPFDSDVVYGPIQVSGGTVNSTTISGQLVDCDLSPVTNGLIITTFDGVTTYHYLEGSMFELDLTTCETTSEISVVGVDLDNQVQSQAETVAAGVATDLGNLETCEDPLTDYILITIDGVTAIYVDVTVSSDSSGTGGGYTYIQSRSNTNPNGTTSMIGFGFEGNSAGDYSASNFIEVILNADLGWQFQGGSFSSFVVTEYGDPGASIKGDFSGTLESGGSTSTVVGSFDVIR